MFDSLAVDGESIRRTLVGDPNDSAPDPGEFFTPEFMREFTEFDSFGAFCAAGPESLSAGDPGDVDDDRLDEYVDDVTAFDSWREMRNQAAEREIVDQLTV